LPIFKQAAGQPPRGLGDDDHSGIRQCLQSRSQIGGFADDGRLQRRAGPDQIADHDETGGNADADPKCAGRSGDGFQVIDRLDDGQGGTRGSLRIIFVRLRIAEVDQDTVADVVRDEAIEPRHHAGDAAVVGGDHLAQVLGIEAAAERRRTDKIGEHDGQLAALGNRRRRHRDALARSGLAAAMGGTTIAAELVAGRVLAAAGAAYPRQRRAAFAAEPLAAHRLRAAARAVHAHLSWPMAVKLSALEKHGIGCQSNVVRVRAICPGSRAGLRVRTAYATDDALNDTNCLPKATVQLS
jgi:hypothetical protein